MKKGLELAGFADFYCYFGPLLPYVLAQDWTKLRYLGFYSIGLDFFWLEDFGSWS